MRIRLGKDSYRAALAVLEWAGRIADENTVVRVEFPHYTASFRFQFPMRLGDAPRRASNAEDPTIVVRFPTSHPLEGMTRIFVSPDLEVFERHGITDAPLQLRFGLSPEEKLHALDIARKYMEEMLGGVKRPARVMLSQRPFFSSDVNVAIWVRGELRGSWIAEGYSFNEGVEEATRHALNDLRFKPVAVEEFGDARVQIALLHPLRIPLSKKTIKRGHVFPEKGYVLTHKGTKGWFLPEVLNVRMFRSLSDFLTDLAEEKAGIKKGLLKSADIRIFEIEDFIESADRSSVVSLHGPMPEVSPYRHEDARARFRAAADSLCTALESDGNLRPITSLHSRRVAQVDWVRAAFCAWALAEYGFAVHEARYREAARKCCEFLQMHILEKAQAVPNVELALAYFGRAALALGRVADVHAAAVYILGNVSRAAYDPISYAQVAGFLRASGIETSRPIVEAMEKKLVEEFKNARSTGVSMSLASWAEAAALFAHTNPVFSEEIYAWLVAQQLPRGAFPDLTDSDFVYTRGTGKIVEVLALRSRYREQIERALAWLFSMQYGSDCMFFVSPDVRSRLTGAFRHDYLNQDAWIDSAGHVLLAASRLAQRS